MNKLPNLSPSGFGLWTRCQGAWWFEKVAKRRGPTTPSQRIGTDVHAQLETFLLTGDFPGEDAAIGQIARAGQEHLVDLREAVVERGAEVETVFKLHEGWNGSGLPIYCVADLVEHEPPRITDHKTTKDIYSPYIPSARELSKNPQMLWYGYLAFRDTRPIEFGMQHIYYQTKNGPASRVVECTTSWQLAEDNAAVFLEASKHMRVAVEVPRAEMMDFNTGSCGDYGGCPHQSYCPAHTQTRRQRGLAMGFRERIAAKKAAKAKVQDAQAADHIGEGQSNPPDTPGTATVTVVMLDEISEIVFNHLDEDADRPAIAAWLLGEGRPHLISVGFGVNQVGKICDFIEGTGMSAVPLSPAKAPEASEESIDPDYAEAVDDTTGKVPVEDADDLKADIDVATAKAWQGVLTYLEVKGGSVRVEDTGLRDLILEAVGGKRLSAKKRIGFLGAMQDAGQPVNFNSIHVFTGDLPPAVSPPDPTPATDGPVTVTVKADLPARTLQRTVHSPITASYDAPLVICVGAMPEGQPVVTLDEILEDFYTEVEEANDAVHYTAVEYGKGSGMVAALAAVQLGRNFRPTAWVVVPVDHPMAKYLPRIFPNALVVRGLR